MSETYRIHFGVSIKSKYYRQAIELANLVDGYVVLGENENAWHIVTLTDNELDILAALYSIASRLPLPKIFGADVRTLYAYCLSSGSYNYVHDSLAKTKRVFKAATLLKSETGQSLPQIAKYIYEKYIKVIESDMNKVAERLKNEKLIDYIDSNNQTWIKAERKVIEPIEVYRTIKELIVKENYFEAINVYYQSIGDEFYSQLTPELIYLKRLAQIPITGRDLLFFRSFSSRDQVIEEHLEDYVDCIDKVLKQLFEVGRKTPLEIILELAPTMEQKVKQKKEDWHSGVYLYKGEFKRDNTPVTLDTFSAKFDACPKGRLFERYPDQVQHCRIVEYYQDPKYQGLWITYSPSSYQTQIIDQGLHLNLIEAYSHKSWKQYRGKWRKEPDFVSITSFEEISESNYATRGIDYTGRSHVINGQIYFEVKLHRQDSIALIENPFVELVQEVLREAENLLREGCGLPRIGEGWLSETQLYRLVKKIFPDAVQHASPNWLRPQHLDVFVPSEKLAFEYQGKQHFESIDYFGGQESFVNTKKRDQIKAQKCKENNIILLEWLYTESIDEASLISKIKTVR